MQLLVVGSYNSEIIQAIEIVKKQNVNVSFVHSEIEAFEMIRSGNSADIILMDMNCNISSFILNCQQEHIAINLVAYGINPKPSEAVLAVRAGAKDFLPLPPDEKLIAAILGLMADVDKRIIYKSPAMQRVIDISNRIAKSDAHVFIVGESGTGKEVLARYIHNNSKRDKKRFISVNCAAIPDNLLESELFGHEKGAFTGATNRRIGKFEESSAGTLLLDEITEMDIRLQAKLLRAIQEQEIDRVGGSSPIPVNLRIIATSNRNVEEEVKKGNFREDLYFRLNIISIEVPPLRERSEDIDDLSNFFIEKYCKANNLAIKNITGPALHMLKNYSWQGNIRQLENQIHRAVLLSMNDTIDVVDIQLKATNKNDSSAHENNELKFITNTLNYCMGDMNQAAHILGISISSIASKLANIEKEYKERNNHNVKEFA